MIPVGRVIASLVLLCVLADWNSEARAIQIDELVAAAQKERVFDFYGPSTLTAVGARTLGEAFNRRYGVNIKFQYHPSGNMTRDVGKVVGLAPSGVPPEWDLMAVHDAAHGTLWLKKMHKPFAYHSLGIDRKLIHYDSGVVSFANQFALPAYNKTILPAKDVPKRWEDLLDPKWKGGKLGVTALDHLARLAIVWGEQKATEYVKALAKQEPSPGRMGTLYSRLQLGEILVIVSIVDSYIHRAKQAGAPIAFAEEVQPLIAPAFQAGVLKGARHPNAGHLFAIFLTSPEAQEIWEKYAGQTSADIPGTTAHRYVQGKTVLYMNQNHAAMVDRLVREYGKILGLTG
jgi:iron(III) transport system substrate-binding protein